MFFVVSTRLTCCIANHRISICLSPPGPLRCRMCGRLVLGQGAKVLSGSTQGIYPRHLRKLKASGSRNSRVIREMMRKEMK